MPDGNPLVSVIVPNYNHVAFLEKRLNSIFEQTFSNYEVILLDDASTDGSHRVIDRYRKTRNIKAIINDFNSGNTFKQWNLGINHANGEYVWIAESDDFADPNLVKRLVDVLIKNQNVGLAYCQSSYVNTQNEIIGSHSDDFAKVYKEVWTNQFIMHGNEFLKRYMTSINSIPNASAVIFRKSAYDGIGGAVENLRLCADWMTWSKILLGHDVAFIPEPLNYYRLHPSTVRNSVQIKTNYLIEYMQVVKFILNNVVISSEEKKRSLKQIKKRWIRVCLNQPYHIYSRDFSKIFNDVAILFNRLAANYFIFLGFLLPLLKPIRTLWNNK
ncbi:MAG: glycosyltransferase [Desulfobacterales bacterium]|nr:glycosyltransferase [Desulfobacterales bacterium]